MNHYLYIYIKWTILFIRDLSILKHFIFQSLCEYFYVLSYYILEFKILEYFILIFILEKVQPNRFSIDFWTDLKDLQ